MSNSESTQKIKWGEILVFYAIAIAVSAPFRLNLIQLKDTFPLPFGLNIFYNILRGIGPAVGFVVTFYVIKSSVRKEISLLGKSKLSVISIMTFPIGLAIVGVNNEISQDKHYYGFIVGIMLILYALGEEYGWRGYLQQALSPLSLIKKVLLIATLWYIWHLNFLIPTISWKIHVIHYLSLLLGSWGLLKVSESTYSILFAAAVHLSFNILSDVDTGFNNKLLILIPSVAIWIFLIIVISRQAKPI